MATLEEIVRHEVRWYASSGEGLNARLFPCLDYTHKTYAVVVVDYPAKKSREGTGDVVVMARIFGDKVIIEADYTDKPLYKRLMERHEVPRDKIILAYAGEPADEYFARLPLPERNYDKLTIDEPAKEPTAGD
jgi:XisI protein